MKISHHIWFFLLLTCSFYLLNVFLLLPSHQRTMFVSKGKLSLSTCYFFTFYIFFSFLSNIFYLVRPGLRKHLLEFLSTKNTWYDGFSLQVAHGRGQHGTVDILSVSVDITNCHELIYAVYTQATSKWKPSY